MVRAVQDVDTSEVRVIVPLRNNQSNISFQKAEREKVVTTVSDHIEDSVRLRYVRRDGAARFDYFWRVGILHGTYVSKLHQLFPSHRLIIWF